MGVAITERHGGQRFHPFNGGRRPSAAGATGRVCIYWQAGRCSRHPCPFIHGELDGTKKTMKKNAANFVWINPSSNPHPLPRPHPPPAAETQSDPPAKVKADPQPSPAKVKVDRQPPSANNEVVAGKDSSFGEKGEINVGDGFSLLASLQGHQNAITGITLPSGSDKLYSSSQDETVRAWDCHTGQCLGAVDMGGNVGCMISEKKGQWIFVGIPNAVKACNTKTTAVLTLDGPIGQVYALAVDDNDDDCMTLFAGTQDGRILAWKFVVGDCFEPVSSLCGHQCSVVSLVIGGGGRLYSGSMDNSIRVWDLATLQCLHNLSTAHTDVVTSLLCWNQFLLSASLDGTIKVWALTENNKGGMELRYTHNEGHGGVLALSEMVDAQAKPVLCCAGNDNKVWFHDLPSFKERGEILVAKVGVRAAGSGPGGLLFTGDGTGDLKVWKWIAKEAPVSA